MANPFQLNPNESILYRSQPSRKWYILAWRIGVGIFEVFIFMLLSFTSFTGLAKGLLATFLPAAPADVLSRGIFQGIVPILLIAWFAEDTARIFTSELILTSQRIWTKGSPYAWTSRRETPLNEIMSMSFRRDALFIHLKYTKKIQIHVFPDGRLIVKAFAQFTGKPDAI
jgi:hypothetical protein